MPFNETWHPKHDHRSQNAERSKQPADPRRARPPHLPPRDQREADREHELRDPGGNVGADARAGCPLTQRKVESAPRKDRGHEGGHRRREDSTGGAKTSLRNQRAAREREELALARRDSGPQKTDPEREMLNDRTRSRNADAEDTAEHDFKKGENGHRQQGEAGEAVFKSVERPHLAAADLRCLNASRSFKARSKMSAGTICPRIVLARIAASCCHSGPVAFVTFSPC